jgi:hypothetical protein
MTDMTVGNAEDAARALRGEGELVGEGEFRVVRRIGAVAYKVARSREEQAEYSDDMHLWSDDHEPNRFEIENADRARQQLPTGLAIPDITHYVVDGRTINAMPYVDGTEMGVCIWGEEHEQDGHDETCLPPEVVAGFDGAGLGDLQLGNVILGRDGVYYAVDCAW